MKASEVEAIETICDIYGVTTLIQLRVFIQLWDEDKSTADLIDDGSPANSRNPKFKRLQGIVRKLMGGYRKGKDDGLGLLEMGEKVENSGRGQVVVLTEKGRQMKRMLHGVMG